VTKVSVSKKRVIILQRRSREQLKNYFIIALACEGENTSNLLSLHASALLGAGINMHTHQVIKESGPQSARNLERMGKMTRRERAA
jgi:hypothetical protein